MSEPWLQKFTQDDFTQHGRWAPHSAQFFAAAPAMAQMLLRLEWCRKPTESHAHCTWCGQPRGDAHRACDGTPCELDVALTAAGLTTQEDRDMARAEMAARAADGAGGASKWRRG